MTTEDTNKFGQKQSKKRTIIKYTSILAVLALIGMVIVTVVLNKGAKDVLDSRETGLDSFESTKLWVLDDMREFLQIKDKEGYEVAKKEMAMHLTTDMKNELFGSSFDSREFIGSSGVRFIDSQYSLDDKDGEYTIYLLCNVTVEEELKILNMVVSVKDNKVYDIISY